MRNAITTGTRHGTTVPEVISGPEIPLHKQREAFMKLRGVTEHADFQSMELWASDSGIIRKTRFSEPSAPAEPAKSDKKKK